MVKELSEFHDVEFEDYHPGCMWGILHVLDYHYWSNVKKMLPQRKYQKKRHIRCCANPKTISIERLQCEEDTGLLDSEANGFNVEPQIETSKTSKHLRPQLQQTGSIHNLEEPSGYGLGWMNPIILIHKKTDTSSARRRRTSFFDGKNSINQVKENSMDQKRKAKEVSGNQVKEYTDVLEMFKVKKELFLDILQDPDVGISKHFPEKHASNRTRKLKKSGSFPVADSSYTRSLTPSKLEHKQKEVWSFSKQERLLNGAHLSNSTPFRRDDESTTRRCITQEPSLSSTGSNHQRWDQLVAIRFKDIKQRIKEKMRRKSGKTVKRLSIDEKETSRSSTTMSQESTKTHADALDHDLSNNRRPVMRRTASLNESLDRYTQLFQHSSSKEPTLDHSRSLRLNNEDKAPSRERVPKFFRRISSLSDLESFCSILNEISRDALSSEAANNDESQEAEVVTEENDHFPTGLSEIEEADDINEDISKEEELIQPSSDSFPDTSSVQHPVMEGSATNPQDHDDQDEADTSFIAQDHCGDISLSGVYIAENNKFSLHSVSDKEGDFCFNYVRDILELSGFIENEFQEMWYSPDQPLNPSLFKELETRLHQKPECSFEGDATNCCHGLLFDLVNEALLEIADKSALPVYFPEAFSFSSHVFGAPKGDHIVQEVWKKVSRVMEFTPDPDQSLDDIVSTDLGKDSWMNLQLQAECVALDLEDLIFDELLEEIICL